MIDLRSDTVTKPTAEMRKAMYEAEVGDEYYRDDPTIIQLQELAAQKLGKKAALFVPSGTMSNAIACLTHTKPRDSVIIEEDAHTYRGEGAHMAVIANVLPKRIRGHRGQLYPDDIEAAIVEDGLLAAPTTLIWLENTHNASGGTCTTVELMEETRKVAVKHGLAIHVDGARIFNAAVALGVDVSDLVRDADSVSFCLSKGLACPFGSLLVGEAEFIEKARRHKAMLGGGMRQAGIMAAAGIVGLQTMVDRLAEDHDNARLLAEGLVELGMKVDLETVQTNMVFLNVPRTMMDIKDFVEELANKGILVVPKPRSNRIRLVTHYGVSSDDIMYTLDVIAGLVSQGDWQSR